jgi:hypothetical protein
VQLSKSETADNARIVRYMTWDSNASHNAVNTASGFWSILTACDWADSSCLTVGGRHRSRMAERTSWTRLTLTEHPRLVVAFPKQLLDVFVNAAVSPVKAMPERRSNSAARLFCGLSRGSGSKCGEPSGSTKAPFTAKSWCARYSACGLVSEKRIGTRVKC